MEWQGFHFHEPFGTPVDDDRAHLQAILTWRSSFLGEPPTFYDRDPEETARKKALVSIEDQIIAYLDGKTPSNT